MAQSQLQLRNWHLKLTNLTNNFVVQTSRFFKHCRKVEKQFSQTARHLQDEKKRVAERESQLNRIVASIESFLQIDIPIDELYLAVPEPGSDVDPFLSTLTRRLSLGLEIKVENGNAKGQIQQQQQQQHCQRQSQSQHQPQNRLTAQEKNLVILLQKENEEKSSQINSLLEHIEQSDARDSRLHRLAEKFTTLATDFERILNGNANDLSDSESCSGDIYSASEQNQEEIEIATETEEEADDDEENDDPLENSWQDLMTAIEQASQNLQSYCDYRRNPVDIFRRNYVHFQETPFCPPFNEFLHLVESEFIRLWKNEDRRQIYENVRKIDMGSQTETDQNQNQHQCQDNVFKSSKHQNDSNQLLMQEKHLVENKLAHLSKLENSLQLRECELRLEETEFKRRVSEFSREKNQWEIKKKEQQEQLQIKMKIQEQIQNQNQLVTSISPNETDILVPSARSSMSLNDLMESRSNFPMKNGLNYSSVSSPSASILLSPPPDLRAASFDRCKRFPHFHLLWDRFDEISNCAKSSGLQSGFNRYHFYASRMNDILNYFTNSNGNSSGTGENHSCQLSEQLESHKFVSIIKAHYGVQISDSDSDSNQKKLTACLASESQRIVAIGYGSTGLQATEKAVQLTHDQLFSQRTEDEKQDGFSSSGFSACLLNPNPVKVKMKEESDSAHFSHGCGDAPLINIDY